MSDRSERSSERRVVVNSHSRHRDPSYHRDHPQNPAQGRAQNEPRAIPLERPSRPDIASPSYQLSPGSTERPRRDSNAAIPGSLFPRAHLPRGNSQPVINQERSSQPSEFRSNLSGIRSEFAAIDTGDYKGCEKFIKANPEILDEEAQDFVEEAFAALLAGKDAYARSCVQQSLLIRELEDLKTKERRLFLDNLIGKDKKATKTFLGDRDAALSRLRERIPSISRSEARTVQSLTNIPPSYPPIPSNPDRHQENVPVPGPALPFPQRKVSISQYVPSRNGRDTLSNGPTYYGPEGRVDTLDSRYAIRPTGKTFFTMGRVFATLWHSAAGSSRGGRRDSWTSTGRFNQQIISHIQRMAVVKEEHGGCWCVPINTNNGQGVGKSGLSTSDIAAHAIIHMEDKEPQFGRNEPKMTKRPIVVRPAGPDQKLDPMSRINFGKVYTVEHNIRVMNVGNITAESMPYFESYWRNKVREAPRISQRT